MNHKNRVYFILDCQSGNIKIGKSINPQKRARTLQTGCPGKLKLLAAIDGGIYMESALHAYFKSYNIHGEWFKKGHILKDFLYNGRKIYLSTIIDEVGPLVKKTVLKYLEQRAKNKPFIYVGKRRATVKRIMRPSWAGPVKMIDPKEYKIRKATP